MKYLLLLICLLPLASVAQEDAKYLQGAVPVVDGKVVFTYEVDAPGLTREQIFVRVFKMAQERFKTEGEEKGRVLYQSMDEGTIVCWGEEYLVFKKAALVLDRSVVVYQTSYTCLPGSCKLEISRFRYMYGENPKPTYAEDWITDEHAYDKKRDKLIRGSDKFRIKTIDLVEELQTLLEETLTDSGSTIPAKKVQKDVLPVTVQTHTLSDTDVKRLTQREGYQRLLPTEITGNFINMLMHGRMLIVGENDKEQGVSTQWGGIGYFLNKPVIYSFVVKTEGSEYKAIKNSDTYTLVWTPGNTGQSFYKELIFECKKLVAQPVASASLGAGIKEELAVLPELLTGEITAVWAK